MSNSDETMMAIKLIVESVIMAKERDIMQLRADVCSTYDVSVVNLAKSIWLNVVRCSIVNRIRSQLSMHQQVSISDIASLIHDVLSSNHLIM